MNKQLSEQKREVMQYQTNYCLTFSSHVASFRTQTPAMFVSAINILTYEIPSKPLNF
jgi:hypothetical protein